LLCVEVLLFFSFFICDGWLIPSPEPPLFHLFLEKSLCIGPDSSWSRSLSLQFSITSWQKSRTTRRSWSLPAPRTVLDSCLEHWRLV
jgi:hypothetical protein